MDSNKSSNGIMNMLDQLMKIKVYFDRGFAYTRYARDLMLVLMTLKMFEIALIAVIPITIFALIVIMFVGYLDFKNGIWKKEAKYLTEKINPYYEERFDRIEKMLRGRIK